MLSATSAAVSTARDASPGFSDVLKSWRRRRRMSQLELAVESGVSQRHVSFLESGRSRPSRTMILQLSETLEVPLRERNAWRLAGGFAPMFAARPFDDPEMQAVTSPPTSCGSRASSRPTRRPRRSFARWPATANVCPLRAAAGP